MGPQSPVDMKPDTATLLGAFTPRGNSPTSPKYKVFLTKLVNTVT